MRYFLKHKDRDVAVFEYNIGSRGDVEVVIIYKDSMRHLPLPVQAFLLDKEGCVECETDDIFILSEEGQQYLSDWLADRAIPINRNNLADYIPKGKINVEWLLDNHSLSFNDCYWTVAEDEAQQRWEDIRLRPASLETYQLIDGESRNTAKRNGSSAALGGQLEKFWFRSEDETLMLYKHTGLNEILSIRERFASIIYQRQGITACNYRYVKDSKQDDYIIGCTCSAFTRDDIELVTASDLLEEYKMIQTTEPYDAIIQLCGLKGLSEQAVSDYLDAQIIVDFLITNRDRHFNNIGFLRDADTLRFISAAPVYDSGSSLYMEREQPETVENTTVNGMYKTEMECIKRIRNLSVIDLDKLPAPFEYRQLLDESHDIPEYRKEALVKLYSDKIVYLRGYVNSHSTSNRKTDYSQPAQADISKHLAYIDPKDFNRYKIYPPEPKAEAQVCNSANVREEVKDNIEIDTGTNEIKE